MLDRQNPTSSGRAATLAPVLAAPLLAALLLVALAAICFAPSPATAQDAPSPEDTALARSLFQQGMDAIDGHDYETGADLLGRSLEVRDSIVVRANYALALIELGRLVEASEHFRTVQRETERGSDANQLAAVQLAQIQPRLGSLQIDVAGATEGIEVRVDGRTVPHASLGVSQPADPGRWEVALYRAERELATAVVNVTRGQTAHVALTAPPPTAEELAEAEAANTRIIERERIVVRESGGVEEEPWFWLLISGLAVGAVVAIVTAIVVSDQSNGDLEDGSSGTTFLTLVEFR